MQIKLSPLSHTWLIDIDGTILKHNGHKFNGDQLLPSVKSFWEKIPPEDAVILLSSRKENEKEATLNFLRLHNLRFNHAIFDLPMGERCLINDKKPSGLNTALAINIDRDYGLTDINFQIDTNL